MILKKSLDNISNDFKLVYLKYIEEHLEHLELIY